MNCARRDFVGKKIERRETNQTPYYTVIGDRERSNEEYGVNCGPWWYGRSVIPRTEPLSPEHLSKFRGSSGVEQRTETEPPTAGDTHVYVKYYIYLLNIAR